MNPCFHQSAYMIRHLYLSFAFICGLIFLNLSEPLP